MFDITISKILIGLLHENWLARNIYGCPKNSQQVAINYGNKPSGV